MALARTDRILTIIVTATLTSAAWIVAGGSLIEMSYSDSQRETTRPAEAVKKIAELPETTMVDSGEGAAFPDENDEPETVASIDLNDGEGVTQPKEEETRSLMVPVLNVRPDDLTDTFSRMSRQGSSLHEALDIMAPAGTSVVAAAPGMIEKIFVSRAGGQTLYVRSTDGKTIHYYAHLGEYAEGLREGQRVRRGQRLGTVGSTGNASRDAPHLHFAILRTTRDAKWWEPASAVNPYPLLTRE
ncbi:MAG: M23 family metallopeptidase [Pontixanthobacter sp.]